MYQFMVFKKSRLTKRALDAGDCRFAACGIFKHLPRFEFFLLPNIVHARPSAMFRERKPLDGLP